MSARYFYSFICAAAALLLPLASNVQAQGYPVRSGVIRARLDSNKSMYHLGEPIMLRLTLINRTAQKVLFVHATPYGLSRLEVTNANGKVRPGRVGGPCVCQRRNYSTPLDPGRPVVVEYNDSRITERQGEGYVAGPLREWADINDWGYVLRQPGTYRLTASLNVSAVGTTGSFFTTSPADKSNAVHITIIR